MNKKILKTSFGLIAASAIIVPSVVLTGCSSSLSSNVGFVAFSAKSNMSAEESVTDMANNESGYNAIDIAREGFTKLTNDQISKELRYTIGEYFSAFEFEEESEHLEKEYEVEKVTLNTWTPSTREIVADVTVECEIETDGEETEITVVKPITFTLEPKFSDFTTLVEDLNNYNEQENQYLDIEDLAELYDDNFKTNIEDYFDDGETLNIDTQTTILGYALNPLTFTETTQGDPQSLVIGFDDTKTLFCPTLYNNYVYYLEGSIQPK